MTKSSATLDFDDPSILESIGELGQELEKQQPDNRTKEEKSVDKYLSRQEKARAWAREYYRRPEIKAARKAARDDPKLKAKKKIYNAERAKLPHVKIKRKEYSRKYYLKIKDTPEYKAKKKKIKEDPVLAAKKKEYDREYAKNPNNKRRISRQRKESRKRLAEMAKDVLAERERKANIALGKIEEALNWENSESQYLEGWKGND